MKVKIEEMEVDIHGHERLEELAWKIAIAAAEAGPKRTEIRDKIKAAHRHRFPRFLSLQSREQVLAIWTRDRLRELAVAKMPSAQ